MLRWKFMLAVAAASALAAPAGAADIKELFTHAKNNTPSAYACFARIYEADHLRAHPKQRIAKIRVLAAYHNDKFMPWIDLRADARLRDGAKAGFDGTCAITKEAWPTTCDLGCDAGSVDVTLKDADTIILTPPPRATVFGGKTADKGADGQYHMSDDLVFRLDAAPLSACVGLGQTKADENILRGGP